MMVHDVVVVGAGIGGLTTAALLAERGLKVCLLERGEELGGCAIPARHQSYEFAPGAGLYLDWGPDELLAHLFARLSVPAPETLRARPAYIFLLPDRAAVEVSQVDEIFFASLNAAFPECAAAAVRFYHEVERLGAALRASRRMSVPVLQLTALERLQAVIRDPHLAPGRRLAGPQTPTATLLARTSPRFRAFIETQLQFFAGLTSARCPFHLAALLLSAARRGLYSFRDGSAALVARLAEAFQRAGGTLRLNSTALRLFYEGGSRAAGVELLSGEKVRAARAIVSNLTVWDTYGRLIGPAHTPPESRARLKQLSGRGCYLLYLGMEERVVERLPGERIMALSEWPAETGPFPADAIFFLNCASHANPRTPLGARAATITTFTEVEPWFSYQSDETSAEALDQSTLERWWERIHDMLPGLGDGIEIIETETPLTLYEKTRRRLGMVSGPGQFLSLQEMPEISSRTAVTDLYRVGDTALPGGGLSAAVRSALLVANEIAPPV